MRLVAGITLVGRAVTILRCEPSTEPTALCVLATATGMLLLSGLWTPVSGALVAIFEVGTLSGSLEIRGTKSYWEPSAWLWHCSGLGRGQLMLDSLDGNASTSEFGRIRHTKEQGHGCVPANP
jgi:hypothetical protein